MAIKTESGARCGSLVALACQINNEALAKAEASGQPAWVSCQERHRRAWNYPAHGMERATVQAIKAWLEYGDEARKRWDDTPIGEDGYGGPLWEEWGHTLRSLLSMDFGHNLDSGTMDSIIHRALSESGCEANR